MGGGRGDGVIGEGGMVKEGWGKGRGGGGEMRKGECGGGEGRRGKGGTLHDKLVLLFWPKKEMNAVN